MTTKKSGRAAGSASGGKPTKTKKTTKKKKRASTKKEPLLTASKNHRARVYITESLHSLPTIGLEELMAKSKPRHVSIRSRLIFYLGAFLGAVVINALLVSVLVILSVK